MMRNQELHLSKVPQFIQKLLKMMKKFPHVLRWSEDGQIVQFLDLQKLQQQVFPSFFHHRNMRSFDRQLHMHEFQKFPRFQNQQNKCAYKHQLFRKGNQKNFKLIKRNNLINREVSESTKEYHENLQKKRNMDENIRQFLKNGINFGETVAKNGQKIHKLIQQLKSVTCKAKKLEIKAQTQKLDFLQRKLNEVVNKTKKVKKLRQEKHSQQHYLSDPSVERTSYQLREQRDNVEELGQIRSVNNIILFQSIDSLFNRRQNKEQEELSLCQNMPSIQKILFEGSHKNYDKKVNEQL